MTSAPAASEVLQVCGVRVQTANERGVELPERRHSAPGFDLHGLGFAGRVSGEDRRLAGRAWLSHGLIIGTKVLASGKL